MIISKVKSKQLLSMTLVLGLVVSSAFTSAYGSALTPVAFQESAPTEQSSLTSRVIVIGLGALGGAVIYSLVTWDWGWALGLLYMEEAGASAASAIASGAMDRISATGAPAAAARIAAETGASAITSARAQTAIASTGAIWAWRWVLLPASVISGALVANGMIYSKN